MEQNSYFMPKIDTQNNWEFGWEPVLTNRNKKEAFKKLNQYPIRYPA